MRSMSVEVSLVLSIRMQGRFVVPLAIIGLSPPSVHRFFASVPGNNLAVEADVILRHSRDRETLLETAAYRAAVERNHVGERVHGLLGIVHDPAGYAVVYDFRHRPPAKGEHRRAASHRFDHHQSERLGPVDRAEKGQRLAEEGGFFAIVDFTDVFDARTVEQRLDNLAEILRVDLVDLGGDAERNAELARDIDGAIRALLARDAAQE